MKSTKFFLSSIVLLVMSLITSSISYAATITNAGVDQTTVAEWRTTTTTKVLDADGDNIYGTDGYHVIYSGPPGIASNIPGYISSITQLASTHTEGWKWGYETIDIASNPTGPDVTNQWAGVFINWYQPWTDWLSFTLQTDASFRLGIISDVTDAHVSPLALNLSHEGTGSNLTINTVPYNLTTDYYFYDITGNSGDVFKLSGQNDTSHPGNGIAGIFFDSTTTVVPEPISFTLFIVGGAILGFRRLWKKFKN